MLIVERQRAIKEMVATRRFIRTEDVAEELDVSVETVRRDFISLERLNVIVRVHGGAAAVEVGDEPSFDARTAADGREKLLIGGAAASLIDASTRSIFIDLGTTALSLARQLPAAFDGMVTTTSLHVAAQVADHSAAEVYITGGRVRPGDLSLAGAGAAGQLGEVFTDIAFLGSGALHHDAGLTDYDADEAAVRRVAIERAQQVWALVDSSKFDRIARTRVCGLEQLTGVVCNAAPVGPLRDALDSAGVRILTPSQS
jgi:DeoR family transcriptional regulator, fructose operon transcriptional repressor